MTNVIERLTIYLGQGNLHVRMIRGKNSKEGPMWEEGRASCVDRVMELKSQKSFYRADPQRGFTVTERKSQEVSGV